MERTVRKAVNEAETEKRKQENSLTWKLCRVLKALKSVF